MGFELVHVVSQWAGAMALLAFAGCFIAAVVGVQFSQATLAPEGAFQLGRRMALVGGGAVIVAAATSTLYWWRIGVASTPAASAVGAALVLATLAFAAAVSRLSNPE
jgi:hypothetical protein